MCVTPIAFSTTCTKGHVAEKAIGDTHIEMKHPACFAVAQKSFLNLQVFLYLTILWLVLMETNLGNILLVSVRCQIDTVHHSSFVCSTKLCPEQFNCWNEHESPLAVENHNRCKNLQSSTRSRGFHILCLFVGGLAHTFFLSFFFFFRKWKLLLSNCNQEQITFRPPAKGANWLENCYTVPIIVVVKYKAWIRDLRTWSDIEPLQGPSFIVHLSWLRLSWKTIEPPWRCIN